MPLVLRKVLLRLQLILLSPDPLQECLHSWHDGLHVAGKYESPTFELSFRALGHRDEGLWFLVFPVCPSSAILIATCAVLHLVRHAGHVVLEIPHRLHHFIHLQVRDLPLEVVDVGVRLRHSLSRKFLRAGRFLRRLQVAANKVIDSALHGLDLGVQVPELLIRRGCRRRTRCCRRPCWFRRHP